MITHANLHYSILQHIIDIRHDIPKGDVRPLPQIWRFAQKWYGQHLDPNWKKWTLQEAKQIFDEFGLSHPVWQLEVSDKRF